MRTNKKKRHFKNPFRLTFDDMFDAAIALVRQEHAPQPPCAKCQKTIALLEKAQNRLERMAIASNLVWYAARGQRRIDP